VFIFDHLGQKGQTFFGACVKPGKKQLSWFYLASGRLRIHEIAGHEIRSEVLPAVHSQGKVGDLLGRAYDRSGAVILNYLL
jgi:hypothetical protein